MSGVELLPCGWGLLRGRKPQISQVFLLEIEFLQYRWGWVGGRAVEHTSSLPLLKKYCSLKLGAGIKRALYSWLYLPRAELLSYWTGMGNVCDANATNSSSSYQDLVDFLEEMFLHFLYSLKPISRIFVHLFFLKNIFHQLWLSYWGESLGGIHAAIQKSSLYMLNF